MEINYNSNFRDNLGSIITEHNYQHRRFKRYGVSIGTEIAKNIEEVCVYIETVRNKPNLQELLKEKFTISRIRPNVYKNKGCSNCEELFFEFKFNIKDGYAVVGFFLPSLFIKNEQKEEMCMFTSNGKSKNSSSRYVEFYFVLFYLPKNY